LVSRYCSYRNVGIKYPDLPDVATIIYLHHSYTLATVRQQKSAAEIRDTELETNSTAKVGAAQYDRISIMDTLGKKKDSEVASCASGREPVVATRPLASFKDRITGLFSSIGNRKGKVRIVLLLMDHESRRFELLLLKFNSRRAKVSDVLSQIPVSGAEELLRLQKYSGIVGKDRVEMPPSRLLADFCQGNEFMVAIPEGFSAEECIRHARTIILLGEKVFNMVCRYGEGPACCVAKCDEKNC